MESNRKSVGNLPPIKKNLTHGLPMGYRWAVIELVGVAERRPIFLDWLAWTCPVFPA
jgi:hypothetical protein